LRVRIEEHVTIELVEERVGGAYPDIRIVERPGSSGSQVVGADVALVDAEPFDVAVDEPATERSLCIYDTTSGDRLITVIEVISPANKSSAGRDLYHRKQTDMRAAGVNLVEIDLLRGSNYVLLAPPERFPAARRNASYYVCVARSMTPGMASVYSISLPDRLPSIRIPLRAQDEDAQLNLQTLIEQAYENGGYGDDIDYRQNPVPPLNAEDAAWADALLREKGRR
jgi:hypothetical protein